MKRIYEKDFENFLMHTNEKSILFEKISEEIKKKKVSSLLDIGAGDGFLSVPLSKQVSRYLAIESSALFAKKLSEKGLDVVRRKFPFTLKEKFDMVLISHALPEKECEKFVKSAWKAVNVGGSLVVITHKEKEGDWSFLLTQMRENEDTTDHLTYEKVVDIMNLLGKTELKKFKTHIYAPNEKEAIEVLSFMFSDGNKKLKHRFLSQNKKVSKIISKYKTSQGIIFPFNNFMIIAVKKT